MAVTPTLEMKKGPVRPLVGSSARGPDQLAGQKQSAYEVDGSGNHLASLAIRKIDPDERNSYLRTSEQGAPEVVWEAGPYEWAPIATGPGDIFAEENGGTLTDAYQRNEPTFRFASEAKWFPEPSTSYALCFWPAN